MPFAYYRQLSSSDKTTYRKSDATKSVALTNAASFQPLVTAIRRALESENRAALQRSAVELLRALTGSLQVPAVSARVLTTRRSSATSELHGLYVQAPDKPAVITVWMRTAAHKKAVAFRTFLRTLLHELCHHLDYHLYGLAESFHTEGFFRRESSLMRQLVPRTPAMRAPENAHRVRRRGTSPGLPSSKDGSPQLELPLADKL